MPLVTTVIIKPPSALTRNKVIYNAQIGKFEDNS